MSETHLGRKSQNSRNSTYKWNSSIFFSIQKDNIEDYNDSDELRRDLMFETEDELESDLANQIGSIDADGSNCNMPWECNRPCPIGYFR